MCIGPLHQNPVSLGDCLAGNVLHTFVGSHRRQFDAHEGTKSRLKTYLHRWGESLRDMTRGARERRALLLLDGLL